MWGMPISENAVSKRFYDIIIGTEKGFRFLEMENCLQWQNRCYKTYLYCFLSSKR